MLRPSMPTSFPFQTQLPWLRHREKALHLPNVNPLTAEAAYIRGFFFSTLSTTF